MDRPRIKTAHRPIQRPDGAVWIGGLLYGLASEIRDNTNLIWTVCQHMDGSVSRTELIAQVSHRTSADPDDVEQVVDFLIASGWVEDAGAAVPANLSPRELERYARNIQLQSWLDLQPRTSPYELQSRLKQCRVTVLGLGGIGCAVAGSLTAAGVGSIRCVDGDRVELSNLNRQLLFGEADLGRLKVQAGTERLRQLNSDVEVTAVAKTLDSPADIAEQVRGSDLFVLCADRPREIELWADEVSRDLGLPWVIACYAGPKLAVGAFVPGQTPCYGCLLAGERDRLTQAGQADLIFLKGTPSFNPVMAMTAQISGNFAALEIISYLLGWKVQTAGGQLHWNLAEYSDWHFFPAVASPDCGCTQDPGP